MSFPDFNSTDFPVHQNTEQEGLDGIQVENMTHQDNNFNFNVQSHSTQDAFFHVQNNPEVNWGQNTNDALFSVVVRSYFNN